jgi:hypothetical protein
MTEFKKAAVFVKGARRYRDVRVQVTDDQVLVRNAVSEEPIATYAIEETVKSGMAWDVKDSNSLDVFRLVVQEGCGCGGQKPFQPDAGYSGRLR